MNNSWTSGLFYVLDTETTDANPLGAHLVTSSIVKFSGGVPVDRRSWLVAPEVEISDEAVEIHGITNEHAQANGLKPADALQEIGRMIAQILNAGIPLVVYNSPFDLTMVEAQLRHFGLTSLTETVTPANWRFVIDPFVLVKGYEAYGTREGSWGMRYTLPEVCARYGVPFEETHDATADAVGAGRLAIALMGVDHRMSYAGPQELYTLQTEWRSKTQDKLREYFDRKKIDHDGVDVGFPLHSSFLG